MPAHGAWGSAGTGAGRYTFRGQCLFFSSPNDHCCSTKAAWTEDGVNTASTYCQTKFGDRRDMWDSKHRSWRLKTQAFSPTEAWPVVSAGRRLADEARGGLNVDDPLVHEMFLPNGTRFWATEDAMDYSDVNAGPDVLIPHAGDEGEENDEGEAEEEGEEEVSDWGVYSAISDLWDGVHKLLR